MKITIPKTEIRLSKKSPKLKTIYLDMDETLIHCDENMSNYTVKLDFPIDNGGTISVKYFIKIGRSENQAVLSAISRITFKYLLSDYFYRK